MSRVPLTPDQLRVVESPPESKVVLVAPAGTGKTEVLAARVSHLIDKEGLHPGQEILILAFARTSVQALTERLRQAGSTPGYVRGQTFDSFATSLLLAHRPAGAWPDLGYDDRIRAAVQVLETDGDAREMLSETRHVLVDEIQDLVGVRRRLVMAVIQASSGGFTLLGDPSQAIYDWQDVTRSGDSPILPWLRNHLDFEVIHLKQNFRAKSDLTKAFLRLGPLLDGDNEDSDRAQEEVARAVRSLPKISSIAQAVPILRNTKRNSAILCRNNGQALTISAELHERGVAHRLQRRATDRALPTWIGAQVLNHQKSVMTRDDFEAGLSNLPEWLEVHDPGEGWRHLKRMDGSAANLLDLGRVAESIRTGRVPDSLVWQEPANVVVSTIHRAKGLEFDNVLLCETGGLPESPAELWEELRVTYVGLTRARYDVAVVTPPRVWTKHLDRCDRWVLVGFQAWQRFGIELRGDDVHHLHPGGDHLCESQDVRTVQHYLIDEVRPGDQVELELLMASKVGAPRATYAIKHQSNVIGVTSEAFGRDLHSAIKVNRSWEVKWPKRISDVRIDFVDTVAGIPGAGTSAGLNPCGIWLRPRVIGMGKLDWSGD